MKLTSESQAKKICDNALCNGCLLVSLHLILVLGSVALSGLDCNFSIISAGCEVTGSLMHAQLLP